MILLLILSFGSVGAVLFTPALPEIQSFFGLSIGETQLTVTTYLLGYAVGQLPYGPLANRFGRKRALYIGISIAVVGSFLCALSAPFHAFGLLICARFMQALGACVGLTVSFTMIADVYEQAEATRMISRMMIAFAIMPGIAMTVGGWLTQLFGWESCFYFLALFGLCVLWLASRLPETAKELDHGALRLRSIFGGYRIKFNNQRLLLSALIMGLGTSAIYIFASKAPFIGIDLIGLNPNQFGTFNLIPLVGMLLGCLCSSRLAGRIPVLYILLWGILGALSMSLTMLIPFVISKPTVWSLFFPTLLIYMAETLIFANASSFGLATAKNKSNGSAVLNFMNVGTAVVAVFLTQWMMPEAVLLLPMSFLFLFSLMLLMWFRLRTFA